MVDYYQLLNLGGRDCPTWHTETGADHFYVCGFNGIHVCIQKTKGIELEEKITGCEWLRYYQRETKMSHGKVIKQLCQEKDIQNFLPISILANPLI